MYLSYYKIYFPKNKSNVNAASKNHNCARELDAFSRNSFASKNQNYHQQKFVGHEALITESIYYIACSSVGLVTMVVEDVTGQEKIEKVEQQKC